MNRRKTLTPEEAAEFLGMGPQAIRYQMRKGRLPIGICVKAKSQWRYIIYPAWLDKWLAGEPVSIPDGLSEKED